MASYLTPRRRGSLSAGRDTGGSLFDLHRQMNSLFDDLIDRRSLAQGLSGGSGWPQIEIAQEEGRLRVCAELPGVKEEDIDLTIEDGMLTLSGEKRSEREDDNGYSERTYGRFERRITLPSDADEEACEADFSNGLLTVTVPRKPEKSRGRKIPLGSGEGGQSRSKNEQSPSMQQSAEQPAGQGQHEDWQPEDQQS